jgi:hypothetical protein
MAFFCNGRLQSYLPDSPIGTDAFVWVLVIDYVRSISSVIPVEVRGEELDLGGKSSGCPTL